MSELVLIVFICTVVLWAVIPAAVGLLNARAEKKKPHLQCDNCKYYFPCTKECAYGFCVWSTQDQLKKHGVKCRRHMKVEK